MAAAVRAAMAAVCMKLRRQYEQAAGRVDVAALTSRHCGVMASQHLGTIGKVQR